MQRLITLLMLTFAVAFAAACIITNNVNANVKQPVPTAGTLNIVFS
jgi:hypothetical protein